LAKLQFFMNALLSVEATRRGEFHVFNARTVFRQTRRIGLVTAVLSLALIVPVNAQALGVVEPQPGVGNLTGGDVTPDGAAPAMTQQAKEKVAATLAWSATTKAGDSAGAAAAMNEYTAKWGGPGAGSQSLSTSVTTAAVTARTLGVIQTPQITSYYCGPASGYMVVRFMDGAGIPSKWDGSPSGQSSLANAQHMNTNATHVTDWVSGRWALGVNRWRGNTFYVQVHAPNASLLTAVFAQSVGYTGVPFAGDTVEFAGGAHYNQHPSGRTIGHWIVGYGYSVSGAQGYWADSSTPTYFPNAAPKFSYNTANFATFLQSNGVAY
jgi:hypothetical protein